MAPVHCAAGSDGDTNFGVTSLAAPKAASSSVARYSLTARLAASGFRSVLHSLPGTERCLLASATIRLASTAKPFGADKAFCNARLDDAFEDAAEKVAVSKTFVARPREGRVIGILSSMLKPTTIGTPGLPAPRGRSPAPSGSRTRSRGIRSHQHRIDRGRPIVECEGRALRGPTKDPEQQRSRARGDRLERRRRRQNE